MSQLQIVVNEMLPVYQDQSGKKFINARELHEQMMVGKVFAAWIQDRIDKYDLIENEDFFPILEKTAGRPKTEYWLALDTAKEIAMVQNNHMGRVIRKYFIEVERRFRLQQPKTQAEAMLMYAQQMVETERRVNKLETQVTETNHRVENMSQIIALDTKDWRNEVSKMLNAIAYRKGGKEWYRTIKNESYSVLSNRAGANLDIRLLNKQRKMALQGVPTSTINNVSKLDVINDDKKLTEIYVAVVKEMAIKYQMDKIS